MGSFLALEQMVNGKYLLVLGLLLAVFSLPALASAATGLTIQPTKISLTLEPGESVSGIIKLTSVSDGDSIRIEASVEDFIPVAGAESIQFVGRAPGLTTARDWIDLGGKEIFDLEQGEEVTIPYTITAPPDAEPGSHLGVAFFRATRPPAEKGGAAIVISTRIGMLILITVPGSHLQKGRILDFAGPGFLQRPPANFKIKFENTGTVHFEPKGQMTIANTFGRIISEVPIEGQVVLPTGVKDIKVVWDPTAWWLMGYYTATATLYDGEGTAMSTGSISFWIVPVWYLLGSLAAVIILFFVIRWFKRRVRISIIPQ